MVTDGSRIIKEVHVDDGTTGGKTLYMDSNGSYWEPTWKSSESCGTGETIATVDNKGKIYY